jgi:hypothetical protein
MCNLTSFGPSAKINQPQRLLSTRAVEAGCNAGAGADAETEAEADVDVEADEPLVLLSMFCS